MQRKIVPILGVLACVVSLGACTPETDTTDLETYPEAEQTAPVTPPAEPAMAAAALRGPSGEDLGMVTFTQEGDEVRVLAEIRNAAPGIHGLHLHQNGQCDPPDFTSAGDHFNPTNDPHAGPDDTPRHAGDFGNVEVGDDGTGSVELTTNLLRVGAGGSATGTAPVGATTTGTESETATTAPTTPAAGTAATTAQAHPVVGKSVVLHANEDDLESQPSGDAGGRIACGVVEMGTGPAAGTTGAAGAGTTGTP